MRLESFVLAFVAVLNANASMAQTNDVEQLVAAMLSQTPIIDDVQELTDEIGGRLTGTEANERAAEWALDKFHEADVDAQKEPFTMPRYWVDKDVRIRITDGTVTLTPQAAAKHFSSDLSKFGGRAPLVDAGTGDESDFKSLGDAAAGAILLVELPVTDDEVGLTALSYEYDKTAVVEERAATAGALGVAYTSSRTNNLLYSIGASDGPANDLVLLIMEREVALRAQRLLRRGRLLEITVDADIEEGPPFTSYNVIGEIRGNEVPEEIVVVGAHLDSINLGTGALDNGSNAMMLLDVARQMKALGLRPKRTIRFALWNGEEQGMFGSAGYTQSHKDELDKHVMAVSFDLGTGRINGFFVNGPQEFIDKLDETLQPVSSLGTYAHVNHPVFGTDNFDFMIFGVANLVAIQEDANHASNYHAESDTFDKVDQRQLKLNAAVAAAVTWGFANAEVTWKRRPCVAVRDMVNNTDLGERMKGFGVWNAWLAGQRGCGAE